MGWGRMGGGGRYSLHAFCIHARTPCIPFRDRTTTAVVVRTRKRLTYHHYFGDLFSTFSLDGHRVGATALPAPVTRPVPVLVLWVFGRSPHPHTNPSGATAVPYCICILLRFSYILQHGEGRSCHRVGCGLGLVACAAPFERPGPLSARFPQNNDVAQQVLRT